MNAAPKTSRYLQPSRRNFVAALAGSWIGLSLSMPASARRGRGRGGRDEQDDYHARDYEQARDAVDTGAALPLSEIIAEVKKVIEGDVLDVELLREGSAITYRIRLLTPKGTYHQILVDAKTKTILKIEQQ